MDCLVCYEKQNIKALTQCGHQALCITCCLKNRTIGQDNKCLACTQESPKVIATNNSHLKYREQLCKEEYLFTANIYAPDPKILQFCKSLLQIQCSYSNCFQNIPSIEEYKIHLEKKHRRYLCNLCLEHSTLLITEHILYREQELYQHLQNGDEDNDGTLINKHPYCNFCKQHFFDEDKFLRHMNTQHYKCHICEKQSDKRFIFYQDYIQLDQHFQNCHHPCRDQNCLAAKFVVFTNQSSLQKHMSKVHGVKLKISMFHEQIKTDNIGIDIQDQLLSQIKNTKKEDRKFSDYQLFSQNFKRLNLFKIFGNLKEKSIDEEKKIIYAFLNPQSDEGYKYKKFLTEIFFENVKFDLRKENSINFEIFLNMVRDIVSETNKNNIRQFCIEFVRNSKGEHVLFQDFLNIFGPVLVYKYLYLYSLCCKLNNKKKLQDLISASLYQIPFKVTSILSTSTSWKQLFTRVVVNIQEVIFDFIKSQKIDLQKQIKLSSQRLYQFMKSLNKISLNDLIKLRYLRMFLSNQNSLYIIRQTFVCSLDYIKRNLQKICSQDLIISFLYFNTAVYVFNNQAKITIPRNINPDILKQFLRHFPDLCEKIKFPIQSEEEDYDLNVKFREKNIDKNFDKNCFGQFKYLKKQFIFDLKDQGTNPIELDPEFDFPQLQADPKDIMIQKRNITKNIFQEKTYKEEEFPSLGNDNYKPPPSTKNKVKSSIISLQKKKKQKPQQKKVNYDKQEFPSLGNQNTDQQIEEFQKERVTEISTKKKYINFPQKQNLTKKQFPTLALEQEINNNLFSKDRQKNIKQLKFKGKKNKNDALIFNIMNNNKLQQNLKKKNKKITIYSDNEDEELQTFINKKVKKIDMKDLTIGKKYKANNDNLIKNPDDIKIEDQLTIKQNLKEEDFPSAFPNLDTQDNNQSIYQRRNNQKQKKEIYEERFNIKKQLKEDTQPNKISKNKKKNKKKGKKVILIQITLFKQINQTTQTSNLPLTFFLQIGHLSNSYQLAHYQQKVQ